MNDRSSPLLAAVVLLVSLFLPAAGSEQANLDELRAAVGYSPRDIPACNMPVYVRFDDAGIGKVLGAIGKAAGTTFAFEADVDTTQKISILEPSIPIDELVAKVLAMADLTWVVCGDYVIIRNAGRDL